MSKFTLEAAALSIDEKKSGPCPDPVASSSDGGAALHSPYAIGEEPYADEANKSDSDDTEEDSFSREDGQEDNFESEQDSGQPVRRLSKHWKKVKAAVKVGTGLQKVLEDMMIQKGEENEDRELEHLHIVEQFKMRVTGFSSSLGNNAVAQDNFVREQSKRERRTLRGRRLSRRRQVQVSFKVRLQTKIALATNTIKRSCRLTPYSDLRTVCNAVVLVLSLYKIFAASTMIAYVPLHVDPAFTAFENVTEIVFLMDFLLWLLVTSLSSSEDYQILESPTKALAHRKSDRLFLLSDFVAAVPVHNVCSSLGDINASVCGSRMRYSCLILGVFKTIRIPRMLHCMVLRAQAQLSEGRQKTSFLWWLRVCKILVTVVITWHLLGCVWFLICDASPPAFNPLTDELLSTEENQIPEGFPLLTMYSITMHSIVLIFSGEAVTTMSNRQRVFASMMNFAGILMTSVLIGEVAVLLAKSRAATTEYDLKMEEVNGQMTFLKLPHTLQERVRGFYEFMWTKHRSTGGEPAPFVNELSPSLRSEVQLFLKRKLIVTAAIFKHAPISFIRELVNDLILACFLAGASLSFVLFFTASFVKSLTTMPTPNLLGIAFVVDSSAAKSIC